MAVTLARACPLRKLADPPEGGLAARPPVWVLVGLEAYLDLVIAPHALLVAGTLAAADAFVLAILLGIVLALLLARCGAIRIVGRGVRLG